MAGRIDLPTLVQRIKVDTSGLASAERRAAAFAKNLKAADRDLDVETKRLAADTENAADATERSNDAHRDTTASVGPATKAIREHRRETNEAATATNNLSKATRRTSTDNDTLTRSLRKSREEMRAAKKDSQALHGVFKNLAKVLAPGMIVGLLSFVGPALTTLSSLGAGAVAVAGGLGQMASALGAVSVAAVGSLSQVSGVVAALPGLFGALGTGMLGVKAAFKGVGAYEKAVIKYGADSKQAKTIFAGMAPEVRTFTKTLEPYMKAMSDAGDITRQFATPGFTRGLNAAAPVLDILKSGAKDLAVELGKVGEGLGRYVGSKGFLADMKVLAKSNAANFKQLGGALRPLVGTIKNVAVAAAPMTLALSGSVRKFAEFLEVKTSKRASLTAFFTRAGDQAIKLFHGIGNLAGGLTHIGSIGSKVFFGKDGLAGGFDKTMTRFDEWTKSSKGIDRITGWFTRMKPIAEKTWSAVWNFGKGLTNLGTIGNNVFFGKDGLVGGLDNAARKFADWTNSPGGVKAITGYFAEMKPVASEAWNLVKQVGIDLFNLGRDTNTANLLRSIRTDLLPALSTILGKMATNAPAVMSTFKGIADLAASLDPGVILAAANAFGTMASNIAELVALTPGMGEMLSLLAGAMLAKKFLGGVVAPILKVAGFSAAAGVVGKGAKGAVAKGATTAAESGVAASIKGATTGAGAALGAKGGLKLAGKVALRGLIWGMVADMVGNTIVQFGIEPTAEKGTKGAEGVIGAKKVFEASDKTAEDLATYQKALNDGKAGIEASSEGIAGKLIYGLNTVTTGMGNWFSATKTDDLSTAQAKTIAAIDAETARLTEESRLKKLYFDQTPAGKAAAAAEADKARKEREKRDVEAAKPPAKAARAKATAEGRSEADQRIIAQYERDKENALNPPNRGPQDQSGMAPAPVKTPEIEAAYARETARKKAAALKAAQEAQTAAAQSVKNKTALATESGRRAGLSAGENAPANSRRDLRTPALVAQEAKDKALLAAAQTALDKANTALALLTPANTARPSPLKAALTTSNQRGRITALGDDTGKPGVTRPKVVPIELSPSLKDMETRIGEGVTKVKTMVSVIPGFVTSALTIPVKDSEWYDRGARLGAALAAGIDAGLGTPKVPTPQSAVDRMNARIEARHPGAGGADGGELTGRRGGPREDNLLFRGSRGEFIVNAKAYAKHRSLVNAINAGQFRDGGLVGSAEKAAAASAVLYMPSRVATPAAPQAPRPVEFHIGVVEDGDTLLRRARAADRMLSLAEGGDSNQMRGLGL